MWCHCSVWIFRRCARTFPYRRLRFELFSVHLRCHREIRWFPFFTHGAFFSPLRSTVVSVQHNEINFKSISFVFTSKARVHLDNTNSNAAICFARVLFTPAQNHIKKLWTSFVYSMFSLRYHEPKWSIRSVCMNFELSHCDSFAPIHA